jgi:triacylglycerol lipase
MIAHFTRFMLAIQIAGLTVISLMLINLGWVSSFAGALLISVVLITLPRSCIILSNFFLAQALTPLDWAGKKISMYSKAKLVLQEFYWSSVCWFWILPFAGFTSRNSPDDKGLPVLLIHGYGANSGFWHRISGLLKRAGSSHMAIELEPLLADIDDYAQVINTAIEKLCATTKNEKIVVLAHSMGGLAARAYLRKFGSARTARVITLGTPHFGSTLANFAMGINAMQMRWSVKPGSLSWLTALAQTETPATRALFVSIYSRHDNIVSPQESARLPGATNIAFDLVGHVALGFDTQVLSVVMRELTAARQNK